MGNIPSQSDAVASKPAKRSHEENKNENDSSKKPKISVEPLNLVDINDDCLESIFKHLKLVGLVNVAESDARFTPVARLVYSRRYQSKLVYLNLLLHSTGYKTKDDDDIEIGKEIAEPFLRQFGHLVSSISFIFLDEDSLTSFCPDSTTKPLEKVEKLSVNESCLRRNLSKLNILFPNLSSLELNQVKLMQPKALEVNFPQLKHLVIFNEEQTIPQTTIAELLRLNPQLETLILRYKLDLDFLQSIAEFTPQLEKLVLWAPIDRFDSFGDQKVSFESVKEFKLSSWHKRSDEFLVDMPFKFEKLQKLMLNGFNEFKGGILNFIKQNQDVTQLSLFLNTEWEFFDLDFLKVIGKSPKLIESELSINFMNAIELTELLSEYKHLKKLRLRFLGEPKFRRFQSAVEDEWTLSTHSVDMGCPKHQNQYFYMELERKI